MSQWQDEYHQYLKPLGLERGVKGSRAHHQEIDKFYATIRDEVKLAVNIEQLPDPPPAHRMVTKGQRDEYKQRLAAEIMTQLEPQYETVRKQALLLNDEHRRRTGAEQQLADVEAKADERIKRSEEGYKQRAIAFVKEREAEYQKELFAANDLTGKWQQRALHAESQLIIRSERVIQLQGEVAALAATNESLAVQNEGLHQQVKLLNENISIDKFLQAQGLIPRLAPLTQSTEYARDENVQWREAGLMPREVYEPAQYTVTATGSVINNGTDKTIGTTTFAVAHDYFTRTGHSTKQTQTKTIVALAEQFGADRAQSCYADHARFIAMQATQAAGMLNEMPEVRQSREQLLTIE
jgi:hypothetical protein